MRLIDADWLQERLAKEPVENRTYLRANEIVVDAPTAYDADKVLERLEQEGNSIFSTHFPEDEQEFMDNGIAKGFWRSAEIVKSGGIE